MNTILWTLVALAVIGALIGIATASLSAVWGNWKHRARRHVRLANATLTPGVHPLGKFGKLTDAAITVRHLLYKKGTDAGHIAACGATDICIGTCDDLAGAAEELVTLNTLGVGDPKRMVASEAITAWTRVYQAASGKIAASGTRCVGIATEAATADLDIIEVVDVAALPSPAGSVLIAEGLFTWVAGAAVTDAATVAGVLTTDRIIATPNAVAGAGLLQKAVPTANTITFTTNANFGNGDKIAYQVWRAA